jgi:transketolase
MNPAIKIREGAGPCARPFNSNQNFEEYSVNNATTQDIEMLAINTVRTLSMDAVEQAKSGHPGTAMALAPVMVELWQRHLRFDPANPLWPDRDRFVLSVGHASMLEYAMLHLSGVRQMDENGKDIGEAVSIEDIKNFRQLGSRCPGHPEYRHTSGVETTTGPLGQGYGNSVGMAMAAAWMGARYNKSNRALFSHKVYALGGDGCMMEGVASEAASLAGHLKLSNLCWIYDSNSITIEGSTSLAFTENVQARFEAYGWRVEHIKDANDQSAMGAAFARFKKETAKPTLIIVDSHIAWGAPKKQDTHGAHGSPLGEDEIKATKKVYGWPEDAKFLVPAEVRKFFSEGIGKRGLELSGAWAREFEAYKKEHADLGSQIESLQRGDTPAGFDPQWPVFPADPKGIATRASSHKVLNALGAKLPWLIGGSADLAPSTLTSLDFEGAGHFQAEDRAGRNLHFGVREHAMGAVLNGLALSKLRSYGATFLIFSDYMKPAIRLAALMELPVTYVFTHDSIGVGEDGPTHQPIEQLASLRSIPGLITLRPCDANEVCEAWKLVAAQKRHPVALALSRQNLPTLDRSKLAPATGLAKGAYVLAGDLSKQADLILIGTGSEVILCLEAREELAKQGIHAWVVSMPSWELFERQTDAYKEQVLPKAVSARLAVEQGSAFGWERYTGPQGRTVCMRGFGASAPLSVLQKHFGFTVENVMAEAKAMLKR